MFATIEIDVFHSFLMLIISFILISIIRKLNSYFKNGLDDLSSITDSHYWTNIDLVWNSYTCSICNTFLTNNGKQCDNCGICCHENCVKLVKNCKNIYIKDEVTKKHHWVKVSHLFLVDNDRNAEIKCVVCKDECNHIFQNTVVQCCWCQKFVHYECSNSIDSENCNFGEFRKFVIPPNCVIPMKYNQSKQKFKIKCLSHPGWPDWTPVFVISNRQAGNSDGAHVLSYFRRLLNPCQVFDLSVNSPSLLSRWCSVIPTNVKCFILVAGGDGTIAWILNTFQKFSHTVEPKYPIGIIPLGTGNDLSRTLGWGEGYNKNIPLSSYLYNLSLCEEVNLDRWQIVIKPTNIPIYKVISSHFYNYFSIGLDAKVAYDFHRTRQSNLYKPSRIFNKLLYLFFGTRQAVVPEFNGLQMKLEVYIDDIKVEIQNIESLVIFNIPSWGAGVNLWKTEKNTNLSPQKVDDGMLEVVGLYSSFHIAQLQMGLSEPYYIGQGSTIKVKLLDELPVQVDGEPWIQQPAEISVLFCNKAKMLKLYSDSNISN